MNLILLSKLVQGKCPLKINTLNSKVDFEQLIKMIYRSNSNQNYRS